MRLGWRMAGLAFVMSSEAAAGALVGWVIDYFAGTDSRWLLIGGITGIAVGLLSFAKGALTLNRMLAKQEQERRGRGIPHLLRCRMRMRKMKSTTTRIANATTGSEC